MIEQDRLKEMLEQLNAKYFVPKELEQVEPPKAKHLARIAQLETEVSKWKNAHKTISDLLNERVIECERLRQRLEVTNEAIGKALERSVQRDGHPRIN